MQEDFLTCPICLGIANDAVESKCCSHIFCAQCAAPFLEKSCPFCRVDLFSSSASILARKMIGSIPMKCPNEGCQANTTKADLDSHLKLCEFRVYECALCKDFKGLRSEYSKHLCGAHEKDIIDLVHKKQDKQEEEKAGAPRSRDPIGVKTNATLRMSRLGTSGKYYCGGRTIKCACCNGFCGPSNGCNCAACMKLDIEARGLPKGCYVNKEGGTCKMSEGKMHCGRKIGEVSFKWDGYCGPDNGPNCKACQILQMQTQDKYKEIWK